MLYKLNAIFALLFNLAYEMPLHLKKFIYIRYRVLKKHLTIPFVYLCIILKTQLETFYVTVFVRLYSYYLCCVQNKLTFPIVLIQSCVILKTSEVTVLSIFCPCILKEFFILLMVSPKRTQPFLSCTTILCPFEDF